MTEIDCSGTILEDLKRINEIARYYDDLGPRGEGWQSDELINAVANVDNFIKHIEEETS